MMGVVIDAILGFLRAFGLDEMRRWNTRRESRKRSIRLLSLFRKEVGETSGYLSRNMAMAGKTDPLDRVFPANRTRETWMEADAALNAVAKNRAVFDAYADKILDLPGSLPEQLFQYYGDLGPLSEQLRAALRELDVITWEAVQTDFLKRTDTLELALTQALPAHIEPTVVGARQ